MALTAELGNVIANAMNEAGFARHDEHPQYALVKELSHNGEYKVLSAWKNSDGSVLAHIEQNSVAQPDGMTTVYPPVLVVENDKGGRVAVNLHDLEAIAAVLSGEVEF